MNILFTGIGRRVELLQAFRNAALVLNKNLKIYGVDMIDTAPALAYCDYTFRVVGMKESSYIENLLNICRENHIDLLIPTIDTDLEVLSLNKKIFEDAGTRVLISQPDRIKICRDKNKTSQFFIECGLHAPVPSHNFETYAGGFPAFIKPKDGSSSIHTYKVQNFEELVFYAKQIEEYVIQPFIEGKEYTIDIFCDWDGKPVSIVPRERVQVRAGEVLKTRIILDKTMIEESLQLCHVFKPCGPITVQLIQDDRGVNWYIEINPRFGGGAPLSMKAGARSAEAILKLLDGEPVGKEPEIADGAIYSRFDQSVCIEDGSFAIKGVIFDLDDTLYSEKDYIRSGFRAVSQYLGGGYEDKLWSFFSAGKPAIDELLNDINYRGKRDKVIAIYRNHKPSIQLYPGVKEMINALKNKGIKVGMITDGRPIGQRNKLEALGLNEIIDDVIITDELGGPQFRKPCDIAFRIMATQWKLPYEQVVYIGDNPAKDFQGPRQIGMKSIYFMNPDGLYTYTTSGYNGLKTMTEIRKILFSD